MTQEEIIKYTDYLLAEFYKDCLKQLNKENRQVDIVLTNGDFSTLQNMMCEAITNVQNQMLDKACKILKNTIIDDVFANRGSIIKYMSANEFVEYFRKSMEK